MAGAEATSGDLSRTASRSLASITHASRWRDKLREKAGKLKGTIQPTAEEQENNVSDFLGKTVDTRPPTLGLQIPKNEPPESPSFSQSSGYHRSRPKKHKGLSVSFSTNEPDIIGQGGEECEIPAQDVVGSWSKEIDQATAHSKQERMAGLPSSLSAGVLQPSLAVDSIGDQRSSLQRAPTTRKPIGGWEQKRLSMNMEEGLVQSHKAIDLESNNPTGIIHSSSYPETSAGLELTTSLPAQSANSEKVNANYSNQRPAERPSVDQPGSLNPVPVHSNHAMHASTAGAQETVHLRQEESAPHRKSLPIRANEKPLEYTKDTFGNSQHDTALVGQAESDEFYNRVEHLRGVFRLAADKAVDIENKALEHWLRMSSWWFLRGKTNLEKNMEAFMHNKAQADLGQMARHNHQPYVDLAKAWWSIEDVVPDLLRPNSKASSSAMLDKLDGLDFPRLSDAYHELRESMTSFAIFMQQSNLMPSSALLIQGADPCIWLPYPRLGPGFLSSTAWLNPKTLMPRIKRESYPVLFDDTNRYFFLGRTFVELDVLSRRGTEARKIPCLMSIFRERLRPDLEATIVSQDGQVTVHIQHEKNRGPTWGAVSWQSEDYSLLIALSQEVQLGVRIQKDGIKLLQGIYTQLQGIEADWHATKEEELLFDSPLPVFHITGTNSNSKPFPTAPMSNTTVRLFRKTASVMEGATQRYIFDGYRLVARTSLAQKTIHRFSTTFANSTPVLYGNLRGEREAPALLLHLHKDHGDDPLILTFTNIEQRSSFHGLMSGVLQFPGEAVSEDIPLLNMSVVGLSSDADKQPLTYPLGSHTEYKSLKIVSEPQGDGLERILFSKYMRTCLNTSYGSVVDLANLANGELQIGLEVTDIKSIRLYRPAQNNLVVTFANNTFPKEELSSVRDTLELATSQPTIRLYQFPTLEALHIFQYLATGFSVVYDGLASTFSMANRYHKISLHRKQEVVHARIQILSRGEQPKIMYLIAVLSGYPNGKIMSFQLHATDLFESTSKSSQHFLRLIDTKFALPKSPDSKEATWDLVCLDAPDHPTEHGDIVVGFDTERERDDLSRVLPGSVKVSRLQSLRR